MSKNSNRYSRGLKPPYKRNIQPFAGSAVSGKCINPVARAIAVESIKEKHKT